MIRMTKEKMERLVVPVPPLSEQHRIVAKVDELFALCTRLEKSLDATRTTRSRVFSEAFLHEALAPGLGIRRAAE